MPSSRRFLAALGLLLLLGGYVLASRWYGAALRGRATSTGSLAVSVTSGADHGPGSLREALFTTAGAPGSARIDIRVPRIVVETPLPPLVNPHGLSLVAASGAVELDAHALTGAPVLDVDAAHVSISGIAIRNCPGTAILLRAGDFHLTGATIEHCDVGVDVADGLRAIELAHNTFSANRLSVRFAASGAGVRVVENRFSADTDAAVWAVRGKADAADLTAIDVRDNRFTDDRNGVIAANVPMRLEHNLFGNAREAAVHLLGGGAMIRANRISGGAAMGIVAEHASAATISDNEIDHLDAYGIMVRGSANTLVRNNQLHNCGYGMAFVLGDERYPSTAVDNIILSTRYNAIDVIGDSPILRRNRVRQARALALHVEDYQPAGAKPVRAHPFLDGNDWGNDAAAAAGAPSLIGTVSAR